jgi:hypothetical protein
LQNKQKKTPGQIQLEQKKELLDQITRSTSRSKQMSLIHKGTQKKLLSIGDIQKLPLIERVVFAIPQEDPDAKTIYAAVLSLKSPTPVSSSPETLNKNEQGFWSNDKVTVQRLGLSSVAGDGGKVYTFASANFQAVCGWIEGASLMRKTIFAELGKRERI